MKFDRRADTVSVEFERAPEPPSFEAPRTDWLEVAGNIMQGIDTNNISKTYKEYKDAKLKQEKATKEAAILTEGNNFAREVQRLVEVREQTGDNTRFDMSMRKLSDSYLARGLLKATDLATIRNQYDFGYLETSEKSRERFASAEDTRQISLATELQAMYPSLKNYKIQDVLGIYQQVTTANDMYVDLNYKLSQIDKNMDPEGYKKLEETRDDFAKTNTYMNTLLKVQTAASNNPELLTNPVELEKMKQQTIENLVRNGVERPRAIVVTNEAFKASGVLDINKVNVGNLKLANDQLQQVWDYRVNNARDTMAKNNPEVYALSALKSSIGPEAFDRFKTSNPEFVTSLASSIIGTKADVAAADRGIFIDTASKFMEGNATPQAKANLATTAVESVEANGIKDFESLPIVLKNVDGVLARLDNPYTKNVINKLKSSNDVHENVAGDKLDRDLEQKRNFKKIANYINGPTEGGQLFRGSLQFFKDSLRVNDKGQLVYVAPEGKAEALMQGLLDEGVDVYSTLATINKDAAQNLDTKDLKQQWMDFGIPEVGINESVQGGPAYNTAGGKPFISLLPDTTNPFQALRNIVNSLPRNSVSPEEMSEIDAAYTAKVLRDAADRLDKQTQGLSDAAKKEYGKGNAEVSAKAREAAASMRATATRSFSESLVFGKQAPADYEVYKLMDTSEPEESSVEEYTEETIVTPAMAEELGKKLEELETERGYMDNGDVSFDTTEYMRLSNEIAAIRKQLAIIEKQGAENE